MGRSVETISNNVIYFDCSNFEEFEWDDLIDNLHYEIINKYPSFEYHKDKWANYPYRENRIILENKFVSISISEYCGCGAISVFIRNTATDHYFNYPEEEHLAEHWLKQCFPNLKKLISQYVTALKRIGTFSNGESVYELDNANNS